LRETQAPPSVRGWRREGSIASAIRTVSPVGSAQQHRLDHRAPPGLPSSETVSSIAPRQALDAEALRIDRRTQQITMLEQETCRVLRTGCCRRC